MHEITITIKQTEYFIFHREYIDEDLAGYLFIDLEASWSTICETLEEAVECAEHMRLAPAYVEPGRLAWWRRYDGSGKLIGTVSIERVCR